MSQLPPTPTSDAPEPPLVPAQPTHPQQAGPRPPQWTALIDPKALWAGAAAAAASYAAVLLTSAILLIVAVLGVGMSSGRLAPVTIPVTTPGLPDPGSLNPGAVMGQLAAQLVAMTHLGALSTSIEGTIPLLGAFRGDFTAYFVPIGILAVSILSLYSASRIAERKLPSASRVQLLAQSLVSGIVFTVLVNAVAALAAVRLPEGIGFTARPITAAGFWSTVFALFLGVAVSAAARNRTSAATPRLGFPAAWSSSAGLPFLAVSSHFLAFVCVATPVFWVITGVSNGWAGIFSAPLVALNAAGLLFVVGHFGGLWFHAGTSLPGASAAGNMDRVTYGFDAANAAGANLAVMLAAVLLAILCTVAVGVLLLVRRGYTDNSRFSSWCAVPLAYFLLGVALFPLTGMTAAFGVAGLGQGSYTLFPAWWSPVAFLLWGVLAEVAARYLAPYLLPFIPGRLKTLAMAGLAARQQDEGSGVADHRPDPRSAAPAGAAYGPDPSAGVRGVTAAHGAAAAQGTAGLQGTAGPRSAEGPHAMPAGKRLSPAGKKKALLVASAAGVVAALVVGSLVTVSVIKASNGPDKLVGEYLQALIDGDAEKALRISDLGVSNDQRALLSNAVYGAAAKRIDGYTVLSTETTGDTATVLVEVRQDGRLAEVPFTLNKVRPELLDDHWKLKSNGTNIVRFSSDLDLKTFSVNGVSVGTEAAYGGYGTSIELPAFPGEYTLAVPPSEKYLTADEERVTVAIGTGLRAAGDTRLKVRASDELLAQVNREVAALTGKCASSAKLQAEGCPFYKYEFGDVRKVKWSVAANPSVSLSPSYDGTWRVNTESLGKATVKYERNASFYSNDPDWKAETDTMSFPVYGKVTFESGEPAVELSRY